MLQKQTLTIPLGLGINTKTDEKLVEQGTFNLVSENTSFRKVGAAKKRDGYTPLEDIYYSPGSLAGVSAALTDLSNPISCAASTGTNLMLRNEIGEYFYSHKDGFIRPVAVNLPECKMTSHLIYPGRTSIDLVDCDYDPAEDVVLVASRNGVLNSTGEEGSVFSIFDRARGAATNTTEVLSTGGPNLFGYVRAGYTRVSGVSYYYQIFVNANGNLTIYVYNKFGQPYTSIEITGNLSDGASTATRGPIGICRSTDLTKMYILVPTTAATVGRFVEISGQSVTLDTPFDYTGTGWDSASAFYSSGSIHFLYIQTTGQVNKIIFDALGVPSTTDHAVAGATGAVSVAHTSATSFILNESTDMYLHNGTSKSLESRVATTCTDQVAINGIGLTIAIDRLGHNTYMGLSVGVGAAGESVLARKNILTGKTPSGQLSRLASVSSNIVASALPVVVSNNGENKSYGTQLTFYEVDQDYTSNNRAVVGGNIHLQGGYLAEFDGEKLFENGFHLPPKAPTLSSTSAGSLTGTYNYCVVLKYIDSKGQISRSEPSLLTSTGSISAKRVDITILPVPFGIKARRCKVEIYRTVASGSTLYFLAERDVDMFDNAVVTGASIPDDTADSVIEDNAILYTAGGVLANAPGPACKIVAQGGNRVMLGGLEDENELAFSKKKFFGESLNFSDLQRIRIDTSQYNIEGGVSAIGYMDGKWIIFKSNSIFYIAGDGPLETGFDDTFTQPELISAETGCTDPRSVVLSPLGLLFKGDKGIYLLSRSLQTSFIGTGVEEYNDYRVTSSVHLDKKNEVQFTLKKPASGEKYILVFDYYTQQWSVNSGIAAIDSDVFNGEHLVLDEDIKLPLKQVAGSFVDNSAVYSMKVKTPWLKLTGIQDYARFWRCFILGKFKSAHTLRVTVYYDYATDYSEVYDVAPVLADSQYQYTIHLKKQKCQSVQFEILDLDQVGESMELTALTLEVGLRKGAMKLAASRKY